MMPVSRMMMSVLDHHMLARFDSISEIPNDMRSRVSAMSPPTRAQEAKLDV
jgi:hypothetical protein